ncbi:HGGxSTG domain-containing protein [Thioclava sp. GXIMD4216]|uniref:HGGxSTG domain-containing protein n=1 Tax=Thioclava sp. GXIMD4216 TaxID=3131929 RepID=UPI0030D10A81
MGKNVRIICGAKTRKGETCKALAVVGKKRCKHHGGLSTGPRTPEGKAAIAYAQRARWQVYREKVSRRENSKGF